MSDSNSKLQDQYEYKYGFETNIEQETVPKGLNEEIIRIISAKKNEPAWLLEYRLKAFKHWQTMKDPSWAHVNFPKIDFQIHNCKNKAFKKVTFQSKCVFK